MEFESCDHLEKTNFLLVHSKGYESSWSLRVLSILPHSIRKDNSNHVTVLSTSSVLEN